MKIVIAGGTGLIGSRVATELLKHGHTVEILTRHPNHAAGGVQFVQWNAQNEGPWVKSIDGADAVINLAGESVGAGRWTRRQKERITTSRVRATAAIVEAIRKSQRRPSVLVNASAVGYYGHVPEGDVRENSAAGNDFLGKTCALWESEAQGAAEFGARVVMLRTAFVIAREAEAFRRMCLPFRLFAGGPFGSGQQWFPWIHIADVAAGYRFALEQPRLSGPVNLSAPTPVRVRELASELGSALHRPAFIPAPSFGLKIILGEMSDLLLKGQKQIPAKLLEHGFAFQYPTLREALTEAVS